MKLLIHKNIPYQISEMLRNIDGIELVALPREVNEEFTIKSYIELAGLNNAIFITRYIGFREIIMSSFNLKPNVLQVKFESSDYSMVGEKILATLYYASTALQHGAMVSLHLLDERIRIFPFSTKAAADQNQSVQFDFRKDGFLLENILNLTPSSNNPAISNLSDLCVRINRLGMMRLMEVKFNRDDKKLVTAALLFARASTAFQAGVTLAAIGMEVESRTLGRNCVEAAITAYALAKCPDVDVLGMLDFDKHNHYRKMLQEVSKSTQLASTDPILIQLSNILRADPDILETKLKLDYSRLAELSGIKDIYDTIYRYLSADASHTTWDSLKKVGILEEGKLIGVAIQPRFEFIVETLLILLLSQLTALQGLGLAFPDDDIDEVIALYMEFTRNEGVQLLSKLIHNPYAETKRT